MTQAAAREELVRHLDAAHAAWLAGGYPEGSGVLFRQAAERIRCLEERVRRHYGKRRKRRDRYPPGSYSVVPRDEVYDFAWVEVRRALHEGTVGDHAGFRAAVTDVIRGLRARGSPFGTRDVVAITSRVFGVPEDVLAGRRRYLGAVYPRMVAMAAARLLVAGRPASYLALARRFGRRDHSTVFFAVRRLGPLVADVARSEGVCLVRELSS